MSEDSFKVDAPVQATTLPQGTIGPAPGGGLSGGALAGREKLCLASHLNPLCHMGSKAVRREWFPGWNDFMA